jgi:hypothetical protein
MPEWVFDAILYLYALIGLKTVVFGCEWPWQGEGND